MSTSVRASLVAVALLSAACQQDPAGRCGDNSGCGLGQECVDGICIRLDTDHQVGSRCARDADCVAWASCAAGTCALDPGMCTAAVDCAGFWEACASHRCVLASGMCYGQTDCSTWRTCTDHACLLQANRCDVQADCSAWQFCSTDHYCTDVGGSCIGDGDCQAWQTCLTSHCANRPGKCASDPECDPTWQVCDEVNHDCVAAPGRCTASAECSAWETCNAQHSCGPATRCSTNDQCRWPDVCSGGWCTYSAPVASSDVLLWGTLSEGNGGVDALARLSSPTRALVGFRYQDYLFENAYLDPSGRLVYVHGGYNSIPDTIRRFVPDAWEWDDVGQRSVYPSLPDGNDVVLATPCGASDLTDFVMQGGTGAIMCRCQGNDAGYVDTSGTVQVPAGYSVVLAWNEGGSKLAVKSPYEPVVIGADGIERPITGQPASAAWYLDFRAWRTKPGGFWVVAHAGIAPSEVFNLWSIADSGTATLVGPFPGPPAGRGTISPLVLDPSGAVYGWSSGPEVFEDLVMRCRVGDGECAVLYDEANAVTGDYSVYPPHVYVKIHISTLVTGP